MRMGKAFGLLVLALLYPQNHWYFVTRNGLNNIYHEFKVSDVDTSINRIARGILAVLLAVWLLFIISVLRYL